MLLLNGGKNGDALAQQVRNGKSGYTNQTYKLIASYHYHALVFQ